MVDAQYTEDQREASPRRRELVVQANTYFRVGYVQRSVRLYAQAAFILDTELEGRRRARWRTCRSLIGRRAPPHITGTTMTAAGTSPACVA